MITYGLMQGNVSVSEIPSSIRDDRIFSYVLNKEGLLLAIKPLLRLGYLSFINDVSKIDNPMKSGVSW